MSGLAHWFLRIIHPRRSQIPQLLTLTPVWRGYLTRRGQSSWET